MTTLEKIRAEIETIIGERNLDDYDFCSGLICARKIIDKYAEQESEDEWQNGYDRGWTEAEVFYEKEEPFGPCDLCRFNPPSSADGKPCTMCPAEKGGE